MRESFSAHPDNEERPRLSELIQSIDPVGRKTRIVAIDGHGGSGKSELARQLAGALGESAIVHTDDFARPDVPGWDWQRMRKQVLDRILNDQTARYQRYDWDSNRLTEWRDIGIGGTLIVEGVSSMRQELGKYWDFAIWVDAPYEIRLRRGVDRDGEQMRSQWTDIWMLKRRSTSRHTDRKTEPTSSLMARSPSAFDSAFEIGEVTGRLWGSE